MKIHCLKTTITMESTGKLERIKIEFGLLEEDLIQKLGDLRERFWQSGIIKPAEIKDLLRLVRLKRETKLAEEIEKLKISYGLEHAKFLININHSDLLKNPEFTLKWLDTFERLEQAEEAEEAEEAEHILLAPPPPPPRPHPLKTRQPRCHLSDHYCYWDMM
jgi:hypothetical protein